MVRLAFENGFHLHTFYNSLLEYKAPIWNRDTDRHPAVALLDVLSLHTKQSVSALQAMTLNAYSGILFEALPMIGNAPWVMPVGVFHRTRRRGGMQFCPLCLQSDLIPYYRRSWRLALYAACKHHQCLMHEHCPSCREPIAFHRHGVGRKKVIPEDALLLCHNCGFDLRRARPTYLEWQDSRSLSLYHEMSSSFDQGSWDCGRLTLPCGLLYFQGVRALIKAINGRHGQMLRQQLGKNVGLTIGSDHHKNGHVEFEDLNALERLKLLLVVMWLLADWPQRFVRVCAEAHFTRSRLAEDYRSLPFWLASVADEYLDNRSYTPNVSEILAAGWYLLSHQQEVTPLTLGKALGLAKDSSKSVWLLWKMHQNTSL